MVGNDDKRRTGVMMKQATANSDYPSNHMNKVEEDGMIKTEMPQHEIIDD